MVRLTDIIERVQSYHPSADVDLINKAYVYSARMHEGQTRKSGDPYFIHPVSVAGIIAEMCLDTASVCAALLHDVVEDTEVTHGEIEEQFGKEVAFLVDGVTKLGRINFACKEDQQAESFRKMLLAMARDIRVLLVKLADRLDNMRTLGAMKPDSRERIATETLEIYAPLAGRLGIQWLKAELEDLSFEHLHPDAYNELSRRVKKVARDSDRYIADVTKRLTRMLIERGFAVEVKGRVKHLYSIYRKMRQAECDFDQIHDFVAFRVLMENVGDCYAALGVVHSQWTPIPGRFKDYIALPKPNMYQSLHTTLIGPGRRRIEVQIRTYDMHRTAELGIAAHWQYKERTGGLDAKDAVRFAWLRQLLEFQKDVSDPAEFFESVKFDLFPDDVYVFTPKGQVKTFPRGATPVDFAYAIHTEVGNHTVGARVNGSIVPLRYKMHNGDVVEIMTSSQQQPTKNWLDFITTARARSRVRSYLRGEERKRSVSLGRELLEREMRKQGLSMSRFLKQGDADTVLKELNWKSVDEMFSQLGYGRVAPKQVLHVLDARRQDTSRETLKPGLIERTVQKVRKRTEHDGILIEGMDDVLVRFARCCNPLAGDAVTGWITRGRGVAIHRRTCPRAMELDPERRVNVSWSSSANVSLPVSLRVIAADRPGILARVSSTFTESGINITEANCRSSPEGRAMNIFHFSVGDVALLRTLMRTISKIEGVYDVERV